MQEDLIKELGYLALASRLKRISDAMIHSGRAMYQDLGLDIEPNWFLVFKVLQKHGSLSVTEIAGRLHFSHPSVINIVKKMSAKGYLESSPCPNDGRKQNLSLSSSAREILPDLEKVWIAGTFGMEKMLEGRDLLSILDHLEEALQEHSFKDRTITELQNTLNRN